MASLLLLCFILVLSSFSIIGFTELCTTIFSTLVIIRITTPPLLLSPSCVLDLRSHICCREKFIQESQITNLAIPKCRIQYLMKSRRETINNLMEEAIIEADQKGIQVLSLGLLNQEEKLNNNGELYIRRNPQLKVKVVDGSSLAAAVVVNSIPKGTSQVVLVAEAKCIECE
ncbi:very-long-chain aldehyde decarbonylase CER1-like [Nicotiana tabacum]|uniref:Very-long-chain aldehyde decarbonylase CER1-like n=1 Tax=Nicotiana tabacum TaxID=4097 RepID=A0AC58UVJ0_TOBAC